MSKDNRQTQVVEDEEMITLTFEDGVEENFYNMGELDYKGKWYIFLQPVEMEEDFEEDEIIVFELRENQDGEELILPIEDEKLIDKLVDLFNEELEKI